MNFKLAQQRIGSPTSRKCKLNALPFELWEVIIHASIAQEFFCNDYLAVYYHQKLTIRRLVCTLWNKRVVEGPHFWRHISFGLMPAIRRPVGFRRRSDIERRPAIQKPPEYIALCLLRSEQLPLAVSCYTVSPDDQDRAQTFWQMLASHSHRFESVHGRATEEVLELLKGTTSTLAILDIFWYPKPQTTFNMPEGFSPALRKLRLTHVFVPSGRPSSDQLRVLQLSSSGPWSTNMLSDWLAGCPLLEELSLYQLRMHRSSDEVPRSNIIHLPKLRNLDVYHLEDPTSCVALLTRIGSSSLDTIQLYFHECPSTTSLIASLPTYIESTMWNGLSTARRGLLRVVDNSFELALEGVRIHLIGPSVGQDALKWLGPSFRSFKSPHVQADVNIAIGVDNLSAT